MGTAHGNAGACVRIAAEIVAIFATPVVLAACAIANFDQTALLTLVVVLASIGIFFASYEASRPRLRDIMPTVVLAALAAAGRILFAPIPDFKPVSAIAIIAGVAFGRKNGFMVGALAALASNFFFGQGPWTPWQMYAWGLVGYGAGLLAMVPAKRRAVESKNSCRTRSGESLGIASDHPHLVAPDGEAEIVDLPSCQARTAKKNRACSIRRLIDEHPSIVYAYGFLACLGYGFILNAWSILSFFHAQASGWAGILAVYATALPFDIVHGVATVVFLLALYGPWRRKLERVRRKFGLA
ncbi:MAG: ECF transporter S component [Slackia sp.]|nr:ECF transporter S component [Slackia sp.]